MHSVGQLCLECGGPEGGRPLVLEADAPCLLRATSWTGLEPFEWLSRTLCARHSGDESPAAEQQESRPVE